MEGGVRIMEEERETEGRKGKQEANMKENWRKI